MTGNPGETRDLTVGRDASAGNSPDDCVDLRVCHLAVRSLSVHASAKPCSTVWLTSMSRLGVAIMSLCSGC